MKSKQQITFQWLIWRFRSPKYYQNTFLVINAFDYRKTDLLRRTIANLPGVIDIQELNVRIYKNNIKDPSEDELAGYQNYQMD